jgi:serine/threonine protein kinase
MVYLALDVGIAQWRVVKEGLPRLSPRDNRPLQWEATLMAAAAHANVMPVLYAGADSNIDYFVMPWMVGRPLASVHRERLHRRQAETGVLHTDPGTLWTLNEIADVLGGIASAARHMQRLDPPIVHRDITPSNIYLAERASGAPGTQPMLLDFSIAWQRDSGPATRAGTAGFCSPQQAAGSIPHASDDAWAIAAVAYYLLTNRRPGTRWVDSALREADGTVTWDTQMQCYVAVANVDDPRSLVPSLPEPVALLVMAALAEAPAVRPPVALLLDQLRQSGGQPGTLVGRPLLAFEAEGFRFT